MANGGVRNRQNNRIRISCVFDIDEFDYVHLSKFAAKRMCCGGVSSFGLSKCVWLPEKRNVDAQSYWQYVLKNEVAKWKNRRQRFGAMCKRKLWNDNNNWIFQQDHASAHKTVKVDKFCIYHLPKIFELLDGCKAAGNSVYIPSELNDVSPIERILACCSNEMDRTYGNKSKDMEEHVKSGDKIWNETLQQFMYV